MTLPTLPTDTLHKFFGVGIILALITICYLTSNKLDTYNKQELKADSIKVFQPVALLKIKKNNIKIDFFQRRLTSSSNSNYVYFFNDKIDSLELENLYLKQKLSYDNDYIKENMNHKFGKIYCIILIAGGFGYLAYTFKNILNIWVAYDSVLRDKMLLDNINVDLQNMKLENELEFIHPLRQHFKDVEED